MGKEINSGGDVPEVSQWGVQTRGRTAFAVSRYEWEPDSCAGSLTRRCSIQVNVFDLRTRILVCLSLYGGFSRRSKKLLEPLILTATYFCHVGRNVAFSFPQNHQTDLGISTSFLPKGNNTLSAFPCLLFLSFSHFSLPQKANLHRLYLSSRPSGRKPDGGEESDVDIVIPLALSLSSAKSVSLNWSPLLLWEWFFLLLCSLVRAQSTHLLGPRGRKSLAVTFLTSLWKKESEVLEQ